VGQTASISLSIDLGKHRSLSDLKYALYQFQSPKKEEDKAKFLLEFINSRIISVENRYDPREIVHLCSSAAIPVSQFPQFCQDLYPNNQFLQTNLLILVGSIILEHHLKELKFLTIALSIRI